MSNPADVRRFVFTFQEGTIRIKGLGVRTNEFVVSKVDLQSGATFTDSTNKVLAFLRPEASIVEQKLIDGLVAIGQSGSTLDKITTDLKINLSTIA
jgi:hypothetical protein